MMCRQYVETPGFQIPSGFEALHSACSRVFFKLLGIMFAALLLGACGTGIGNPYGAVIGDEQASAPGVENRSPLSSYAPPASERFDIPISDYQLDESPQQVTGRECGAYTQDDAEEDIVSGRNCIVEAFTDCVPARYLIDLQEGVQRFVSYVSVRKASSGTCQLYHHTVSTYESLGVGEYIQQCALPKLGSSPERACLPD